jgi:hypothetical protein
MACGKGTPAPVKPRERVVPGPNASFEKALANARLPKLQAAPPSAERAAAVEAAMTKNLFPKIATPEAVLRAQPTSGSGEILDDLFRTIAAVAMERAQARAAQRIIDVATDALCGETHPKRRETWPHTCTVLSSLTPATIGAAAGALRKALAEDIATWLSNNANAADREYLKTVINDALLPVLTHPEDFGQDDLLRLLNALVTREWTGGQEADVMNVVFYVVRVCALDTDQDDCDVADVVQHALQKLCELNPQLCGELKAKALEIELMASRLKALAKGKASSKEQLRRALRELTDVTLRVVEAGADEEKAKAVERSRLLFAALFADDAFSFALQFGDLVTSITDDAEKLSPKVKALLTAMLAYAQTYQKDGAEGADPAARRKEVIEALVTAATDRSQRADDWIFSLGVDVGGYVIGHQEIEGKGSMVVPQLALPLGLFLQRKWEGAPGLHLGAFIADVAQYVAFKKDGKTTDVRWDTAIALGGQLGMLVGSMADPFILGVDARYSPTLFSAAASREPASGGTFRFGVFVGYYVPFFDLN